MIAEIRRLAGDGVSAYRIAKTLGVSPRSVHKYAPPGSFDRSRTAAAVAAHKVDAAARRAAQAERYLDIVDDVQARLLGTYEHAAIAGMEGKVRRWKTDRPPARETSDLMKAAQSATIAELRLADHATGDGSQDAVDVILEFGAALRADYAQRHATVDPAGPG